MRRIRLQWFLIPLLVLSICATTSCTTINTGVVPTFVDAGFTILHLVLNHDNVFEVASDSVQLASDAVKVVGIFNANQKPAANPDPNYTRLSILYNKNGVLSQAVFDIKTGDAGMGVLTKGGKTFIRVMDRNASVDATQATEVYVVALNKHTQEFSVDATQGWQNTGVFVALGKVFTVTYERGTWTESSGNVPDTDANGQPVPPPSYLFCNCGEPLPGYSTQALIGRIGDGTGHIPLQVGGSFTGQGYDNDFLWLRMNDSDDHLYDNAGSVTVTIAVDNS